MRQLNIWISNCFVTIQNRVNFADFVSNSKQRKLLNQNLFQNIFKVKAVQNRPQNIRKVRQFYICKTNCFMTIQNRANFVIFLKICFMSAMLCQLKVSIIQIFLK